MQVLTEGLNRAGVHPEGATAAFGGEDGVELGEEARQGVLWLLELVIRSARVL